MFFIGPCTRGESQHDDAWTRKNKFQCPKSLSLKLNVIYYLTRTNKLDNFKGFKI